MEKRELIYEGKAKKVYGSDDPEMCIVSYKDDATAFNGQKKGRIEGKGSVNNRMTNILMSLLGSNGIPTHFVRQLNDTDTVVKKVAIIQLEVIVRNVVAGSMSKRLGLEEGLALTNPVLELCYKNDDLGDPMINDYHATALGIASREDIAEITAMAFKTNETLKSFLLERYIELIDFKLEFGKTADGQIILADEISPDTCRFWDATTKEKLDKDRFRRDMGGVYQAYAEVMERIGGNGQA